MSSTVDSDRAHPAQLVAPGAAGRGASRLAWGLINALQLAYTVVGTSAGIVITLVLTAITRRPALAPAMARRVWAPALLRGAGARLAVEGLERLPAGPAFVVANHQSVIDVPALFRALPFDLHFIVKRELRRVPFLGWYIAATGMIFVDRRAPAEAVAQMRRAAARLRGGASLVSFPEGTRSRDGAIGSFKSAAFVAAIEAGVPVVPVAIDGARAVLPAGGFRVRPGTIRVTVGEPIPTAGLKAEDRGRLAREARERVVQLHRSASSRSESLP